MFLFLDKLFVIFEICFTSQKLKNPCCLSCPCSSLVNALRPSQTTVLTFSLTFKNFACLNGAWKGPNIFLLMTTKCHKKLWHFNFNYVHFNKKPYGKMCFGTFQPNSGLMSFFESPDLVQFCEKVYFGHFYRIKADTAERTYY